MKRTRPKSQPAQALAEVLKATRSVYADLAVRPIERQCIGRAECCHFALTGKTPFLTRAEALLAASAFRATGRTRLPAANDGACPMLDRQTRRCLIYESRPFGCRTHFCAAAGGPYRRGDVADLIHRLEALSAAAGGRDAESLEIAVRAALDSI